MYEMTRRVTYSEVRSDLMLDIAGVTDYLQDASLFHSEDVGQGVYNLTKTGLAWFLSSWQIEVNRYPKYGERVLVRTWPHKFMGFFGHRNFEIVDEKGERLVKANSIWILMDVGKMAPQIPDEEMLKAYDISPALDMEYDKRKILPLKDGEVVETGLSGRIDVIHEMLDNNGHVNNSRYVRAALPYINNLGKTKKMRVDYRHAAKLGDVMHVKVTEDNEKRQIELSDGTTPYVIIETAI